MVAAYRNQTREEEEGREEDAQVEDDDAPCEKEQRSGRSRSRSKMMRRNQHHRQDSYLPTAYLSISAQYAAHPSNARASGNITLPRDS